jgi:hypothetical protein
MHENTRKWYTETWIRKTCDALRANRFKAEYFPNISETRDYILDQIPAGANLGLGGSVSVEELNILPLLEKKGVNIINPYYQDLPRDLVLQRRTESLSSDYYITGTNAVTVDGQLVNIDGLGNRVAALAFGPKHVFVVVSHTKITSSVDEALKRIQTVAAPMNTRRLNRKTPCRETGICMDCDSEERICNATLILRRATLQDRITVVIVGESLGF